MRTHHRRAERLAIARLLLVLAKTAHKRFPDGHHPFGSDIEQVFVATCVAIGDFEGRPMTASNVSTYIDMPRSTVQRKLAELVKRGVITSAGRKYHLADSLKQAPDPLLDIAVKAVKAAQPKE